MSIDARKIDNLKVIFAVHNKIYSNSNLDDLKRKLQEWIYEFYPTELKDIKFINKEGTLFINTKNKDILNDLKYYEDQLDYISLKEK